jgi:DNA-binding beta-propeller fold protein YncE
VSTSTGVSPAPTNLPTDAPVSSGELIRQWAIDAAASSSYDDPDWGPVQATGAPDTPECGDWPTAWASEFPDEVDWLELAYAEAVFPTEIHVYESFSPGQIVSIEVLDLQGVFHEVYLSSPSSGACPGKLTVPVDLGIPVAAVRITIDHSILDDLWNEIDAVELVGHSTGLFVEVELGSPGSTTVDPDPPENFLARVGRDDENDHILNAPGGMDVAILPGYGEVVLVADQINGVLVFDFQGELLDVWETDGLSTASDVKAAPNGDVYVVNWSMEEVVVFSGGSFAFRWGEMGSGPGQFGDDSPEAIAVGPDGTVYVLDRNFDSNGDDFYRIQLFTPQGAYLDEFLIEEPVFAANAMSFGPDGNLYILGFIGGPILKYSQDGTLLAILGKEALSGTGPRFLDIDDAGNLYVSVWSGEGAVIVLDPNGNYLNQFGFRWEDPDGIPPAGYHYQPAGVAVLGDGVFVYVAEWGSGFAHVSAYDNR